MPQEVAHGDDLGPVLQQIRGKGRPQALTTRGDPSRLGVALHLLLDGFDGEGLLRPFAVPKDRALCLPSWNPRSGFHHCGQMSKIPRHDIPVLFRREV
jgi:hypothetical protein